MAKGSFLSRSARSGEHTIGRSSMIKLNALEGIRQTASSQAMFAEFDRRGISHEERRKAILAKHSKKD